MELIVKDAEKKLLLSDAREIISAKLEKRVPVYMHGGDDAVLSQRCGAFVTLHEGHGWEHKLRGCIGRMSSDQPLRETVRDMAFEAAFGDPRFPPLRKQEWLRCNVEVSVLSPMEPCPDPESVHVGIHGLYLTHHGRSGVLLPQVPVEQGWNLEQYLDYICQKAGLPPKSYRAPGARLFTFTAEVFSEKD
ncbi:MAG: AmmeMemoRadiSam system protein A [Spirochaetaceae bacterium]|nr:AmmeMemoRadiSam system protein A [Spirochaetaceae bacterium]